MFFHNRWRALNGEVPYPEFGVRGPAIYCVDALGVWLGGGAVWCLLLLEIHALTVFSVLAWLTVATLALARISDSTSLMNFGGAAGAVRGGFGAQTLGLVLADIVAAGPVLWPPSKRPVQNEPPGAGLSDHGHSGARVQASNATLIDIIRAILSSSISG